MGYSLGIGENTRAMVIARAVREMSKLGEAVGGHRDTFAGLAGMGDLIVTCTSQRSRNRHVGEQLAAGKPIDEIIASMNQVAEGVKASSVIMEFADKYGINMPIAREVDGVINHGNTVEDAYHGLVAETPGHEVHGSGFCAVVGHIHGLLLSASRQQVLESRCRSWVHAIPPEQRALALGLKPVVPPAAPAIAGDRPNRFCGTGVEDRCDGALVLRNPPVTTAQSVHPDRSGPTEQQPPR